MNLIAWPVLLPLLGAIALLLLSAYRARVVLAVTVASLTLVTELLILGHVLRGEILVLQMANWPAPWGISLAADLLSGILLSLSGIVGLLTVLFAANHLQDAPYPGQSAQLNKLRERFGFQALLQFLVMGVNMSFLTGDLFNLFVAFEVMLVASYGLLLIGNELPQLREGFKYVIINLTASAVFVITAGLFYGLSGTLNLADIAQRLSSHGPDARVSVLAILLSLVFATKAALFPLGFWLPNAYPTPAAPASAFFAAILTKVGAYALIRCFTLLFPAEDLLRTVVLGLTAFTMLLGAFGAIARQRWRHVLAFANVSSIGYLLMGAFSGSSAGLSAALYYLINSILVLFSLFIIAALAEQIAGAYYQREGHLSHYPWLGIAFFIAALTLAGIPPSSGFIGKFALISSLLSSRDGLSTWVALSALISGFLLLYACMQIWRGFFWGEVDAVHKVRFSLGSRLITASSVALIAALAIFAGPIYQVAERTAEQLLNQQIYIQAVLGLE